MIHKVITIRWRWKCRKYSIPSAWRLKGFQKVSEGDIVFFEEGAKGAHQLYNHNDFPCIYLDVRTTIGIDVCEYPDSGKVNILPDMNIFESSSAVDYYKGEENVTAKWPEELLRKK